MNESDLVLSIRVILCYFSDLRMVTAVFVVSPTMVVTGICLPTTFGSTMLKRNCVDVPMKSIGIHMTDVLAKQAQTKTTAGGARVAPLLKTATQKAIAYGVQVNMNPNTVMTIPDKEENGAHLSIQWTCKRDRLLFKIRLSISMRLLLSSVLMPWAALSCICLNPK